MNKNIVVIEDDRDIRDLIQYILSEEGYSVKSYDDVQGVEHIIEQQPFVVLLDHRLATGEGASLCLSLKSDENIGHIPVIIISASSNLKQIASDCKADAFLAKPFNLDELVAIVKQYAGSPLHQ